MDEYLAMWKNYVNFNDRTTVRGLWMSVLFNFIAVAVLWVLGCFINFFGILLVLYWIATLIPNISIGIRRLHDINKSGFWLLISIVPLVGSILLIIWFCQGSVDTGNRFGTTQV